MEFGPHAAFIWWSYGVVAMVLAALIAWLVADGRRQQRLLGDLEARGVTRRSAPGRSKSGHAAAETARDVDGQLS